MEEISSIDEVLEFAIAREVEAHRFYTILALQVEDPMSKKVLEELADEELEHKQSLELELMKQGRVTEVKTDKDFDISKYIEGEFEDGVEMDYKDVLALGMQKEEASFRLYVDLVGIVKDMGTREVLIKLAEEEAKHKLRFEVEYETLLKKGSDGSA